MVAIRVGQRAPRDAAAKAGVIQLRSHRPQTRRDISQAFAKRQLGKRHAHELIATREAAFSSVAAVPRDAGVEVASRQETHELRKHEMAVEHKTSTTGPAENNCPGRGSSVVAISDRVHAFRDVSAYHLGSC